MVDSLQQIRLRALENLFEERAHEYEALNQQIISEVNPVNKVRLERQTHAIEVELERLDKSIQVERSKQHSRKVLSGWEEDLPKIDFKKAIEAFSKIQQQFGEDPGMALFLLQNSHSMGGEWCLRRIRDLLAAESADFRQFPIRFYAYDTVDEVGLLCRLSDYLGIQSPILDLQHHTDLVVKKIRSSIQIGSILLLELSVDTPVSLHDRFLPWLLHEFWCPLVRELAELGRNASLARFVLILLMNNVIAPEQIEPFCCRTEEFNREKIVELLLEPWEEGDIRNWLITFSGLKTRLNIEQISSMARVIYLTSKSGEPNSVYTLLIRNLAD
jgi:hypothetical protein